MPEDLEADTIRILISTDNHVGYGERDPIRKDDSWRTFDEIMKLAKAQDVDMVLLGGDLFHENKPSRKSMYQVMRTLRRYCLGMKPCELQFLSDAADVFEGAFQTVNYEDPDINISIPVFSIHGNHDDPSGDGHFCSLDLLQVAGLVNYFGRVPEADNIHVKPVLFQKGRSKLALYGISNVRDERMFRTFRDNKVRFYRPGQQKEEFFNLLTVHQNHYAHTPTSYLPENMLPDYMDLVVWGHEHECLIDPQKNVETGFHVIQPGSSVATSLVPGEAVTKQVAILNIVGKEFQIEKIPLKTVRPFVTREIVLSQDRRFKGLDKKPDNRADITKRLMVVVDEMIEEANAQWLAIHEDDEEDDEEEQPLPLIRLKVEYTAPEGCEYEVENPQRFSNRFAGKVANQNDVVYFYRKKKSGGTRKGKADQKANPLADAADSFEGSEAVRVDKLVQDFMAQQNLKILPQAPFGNAVNQFVSKDDKHAVEMFVMDSLTTQVKGLLSLDDDAVTEGLDAHIAGFRKVMEKNYVEGESQQTRRRMRFKPKPSGWDSDIDGHWMEQPNAIEEAPPSPELASRKRTAASRAADSDEDDDLFGESPAPPPAKATTRKRAAPAKTVAKKAPAKKAPARGRPKKGANPFIDDEDEDMVMEDDDDDLPAPKRAPAAKPAARATRAAAASKTKQTTLNFSQSQTQKPAAKKAQKAIEISDDEISDDAFESMPTTRSRRR
ncbi:Mre11 DNA-binding presumed domain-containing protein [Cercophora newfieldiana]|uniref:Double-strand break repair protein n=1 Tax=Cercophora newfieldiana TaxID=92897 RepID=A0AA39YGG7_9PEZI|nr:Mre11 DNA-binding presumed domain-containing protein [Cercophora newfieldiana]